MWPHVQVGISRHMTTVERGVEWCLLRMCELSQVRRPGVHGPIKRDSRKCLYRWSVVFVQYLDIIFNHVLMLFDSPLTLH